MKTQRGFTLIELMVAIAIVGIVLALAVPSFYNYMLVQRLKSVSAQLVTDINYARSEAVSRGTPVRIAFAQDTNNTCYTLYLSTLNTLSCNCLAGPGSACSSSSTTEVRTMLLPRSTSVRVLTPAHTDPKLGFSAVTGGLVSISTDTTAPPLMAFDIETSIDSTRMLKSTIGRAGRVTVCSANPAMGMPPC